MSLKEGILDAIERFSYRIIGLEGYSRDEVAIILEMKRTANKFLNSEIPLKEAYRHRDLVNENFEPRGLAREAFEYTMRVKGFIPRYEGQPLPENLRTFRAYQEANQRLRELPTAC